jgi:hypothetical protein
MRSLLPLALSTLLFQILSPTYSDSIKLLKLSSGGHCTAWTPIVKQWISAFHCIEREDEDGNTVREETVAIDDTPVRILKEDPKNDLVLLDGPEAAPLPIATKEPTAGEAVTVYGWPSAWNSHRPFLMFGRVSVVNVDEDEAKSRLDPKHDMNMFHLAVAGGTSGGPIVRDADQKVVGMVEWNMRSFPTELGGIRVKAIRKFLGIKD